MSLIIRASLAAGVALMLTSGCGGGYDNPAGPSDGGQTNPPPASGSTSIAIMGDRGAQSFNPNPAPATASRVVSWRNSDTVVHRIVSNDGAFDTGNLAAGATSAAVTLTGDGANYHCTIHPGMIGSIAASSGTPPPCTGQYC
jgi:plastocyanin